MGVACFIPVTRDPQGVEGAVSSLGRLWEDYGVDEFVLLETGQVPEGAIERMKRWAQRLGAGVRVERADYSVERMREGSPRQLVELLRDKFRGGCPEALVLVSSASRWMASAATMAAVEASEECPVGVVHVHFYFGPWRGLVYPYTPRRLQPVLTLHPMVEPRPRGEPAAGRAWPLSLHGPSNMCQETPLVPPLPPLRCAVAELARRVNEALHAPLLVPVEKGSWSCGRLQVEAGGVRLPAADPCREQEMVNLASKLAKFILDLPALSTARGVEELVPIALSWTGLAHLRVEKGAGEESFPNLIARHNVIVDTNLIFYGAHRYAWEGGRVIVPECAVQEVHWKLAEALKAGRIRRPQDISRILAYLALADLEAAGAPFIPTPPGKCDIGIPKTDPTILAGKIMATGDSGAYNYWSRHPASRLATPVKVSFDPEESTKQHVDPDRDPLSLPRLYYSIYQAIILLALLDHQGLIDGFHLYTIKDGAQHEVKVPVTTITKAAGLQEARRH